LEYVFDSTRAVANMIFTGTLERFPDIKFIIPHAGGTLPFLAERLSLIDLSTREIYLKYQKRSPEGVKAYLKDLYYDTALSASRHPMSSLLELVDTTHILFATDYPFCPPALAAKTVEGIGRLFEADDHIRLAVERDNALRLFPRLTS
jgi:predicted TIM-barrel fold metal-dependent hydrolase